MRIKEDLDRIKKAIENNICIDCNNPELCEYCELKNSLIRIEKEIKVLSNDKE